MISYSRHPGLLWKYLAGIIINHIFDFPWIHRNVESLPWGVFLEANSRRWKNLSRPTATCLDRLFPKGSPRTTPDGSQVHYVDVTYLTGWWFQTFFIFHNIWDNPSHWLIFFKMVKTTNQMPFESGWLMWKQSATGRTPGGDQSFFVQRSFWGFSMSDFFG